MPSSWLVLQRFFLRVDDVLFRIFDTRLFVSFHPSDGDVDPHTSISSPRVIRECRGAEASYAEIRQRLPMSRSQDLSMLTNIAWVAEMLDRVMIQRTRAHSRAPSPARVPYAPGIAGATVLDETPASLTEQDERWEGEGYCIHVAVLRPKQAL